MTILSFSPQSKFPNVFSCSAGADIPLEIPISPQGRPYSEIADCSKAIP
jgi:hypothetical protein